MNGEGGGGRGGGGGGGGGGESKAPEVAQRDQPMVSCHAEGKKEKKKSA